MPASSDIPSSTTLIADLGQMYEAYSLLLEYFTIAKLEDVYETYTYRYVSWDSSENQIVQKEDTSNAEKYKKDFLAISRELNGEKQEIFNARKKLIDQSYENGCQPSQETSSRVERVCMENDLADWYHQLQIYLGSSHVVSQFVPPYACKRIQKMANFALHHKEDLPWVTEDGKLGLV